MDTVTRKEEKEYRLVFDKRVLKCEFQMDFKFIFSYGSYRIYVSMSICTCIMMFLCLVPILT